MNNKTKIKNSAKELKAPRDFVVRDGNETFYFATKKEQNDKIAKLFESGKKMKWQGGTVSSGKLYYETRKIEVVSKTVNKLVIR